METKVLKQTNINRFLKRQNDGFQVDLHKQPINFKKNTQTKTNLNELIIDLTKDFDLNTFMNETKESKEIDNTPIPKKDEKPIIHIIYECGTKNSKQRQEYFRELVNRDKHHEVNFSELEEVEVSDSEDDTEIKTKRISFAKADSKLCAHIQGRVSEGPDMKKIKRKAMKKADKDTLVIWYFRFSERNNAKEKQMKWLRDLLSGDPIYAWKPSKIVFVEDADSQAGYFLETNFGTQIELIL